MSNHSILKILKFIKNTNINETDLSCNTLTIQAEPSNDNHVLINFILIIL